MSSTKTIGELETSQTVPSTAWFEMESNGASYKVSFDVMVGKTLDGYTAPGLQQTQAAVTAIAETVKDIQDSLFSADSAALSAQAAEGARLAALQARAVAETMATAAQTARDQAIQAIGDAGPALDAVNGAIEQATYLKNLAQASSDAAAGSAAAAAGSASTAASRADDAGQSASSASASANTAHTEATNSAAAASAASSSASGAAASQSGAATNASAAQKSSVSASLSAAALFPSTLQNPVLFTANAAQGKLNPAAYTANDASFSSGTHTTSVYETFGPISYFRPLAGRTYRVSTQQRVTVNPASGRAYNPWVGWAQLNRDGDLVNYWGGATGVLSVASGDASFSYIATGDALLSVAGTALCRPMAILDWHDGGSDGTNNFATDATIQILSLVFEDITESTTAGASASAAASSASTAAASQTAAGQSASSAHTSETNAATSAGNASTSASQASTSASNAAGSSNTASQYAQQAASARDAAGGSADAASTSASLASGKADLAGSSATAAQTAATQAQGYSATANGAASTAVSQASAASSSAAAASISATLASSVGPGSINQNPYFNTWTDASQPPYGWGWWDASAGIRQDQGFNGHLHSLAFDPAANQNAGVYQDVVTAFGAFIIEITGRATDWQGAGVYVEFFDTPQNHNVVDTTSINCAALADTSGYASRDGGGGGYQRSWSIFHATPINGGIRGARVYAMGNWEGFGERAAKSASFDKIVIRPATAAEIAGQRADANASAALSQITQEASTRAGQDYALGTTQTNIQNDVGGIHSTLSVQAGLLTQLDGRTQGFWGISFNNGRPILSAYYIDSNGNVQTGVYIGGNLYVDGSLLVAKSVQAGVFLDDNGVAFNAFVPGSAMYTRGTGQGTGAVALGAGQSSGIYCVTTPGLLNGHRISVTGGAVNVWGGTYDDGTPAHDPSGACVSVDLLANGGGGWAYVGNIILGPVTYSNFVYTISFGYKIVIQQTPNWGNCQLGLQFTNVGNATAYFQDPSFQAEIIGLK